MLLVFTQKTSPRITYVFKHIFTRILGIELEFTSVIEEFIGEIGPKISYGKQPLGNELFFQSDGLLTQQGIESLDITVRPWKNTKCFFATSTKSAMPFDIFAASFYLLSRYEEFLPHVKDEMTRYPATESLGFKHNFLQQPVVDLWALELKKVLKAQFPDVVFPKKELKIHSIVEASQPFAYAQKGLFRNTLGYISELFKLRFRSIMERTEVIFNLKRDPLNTFNWIIAASKGSDSKISIFFMLGDSLVFSEGISANRKDFKSLLKYVADYMELGLIFSYASLPSYEQLKREKSEMEEITNRDLLSSMNAEFLVQLPDVYRNLVELEVKTDFTMVYRNAPGFRAGTCTPFLFYDLDYEIKTPLTIHPVAASTLAYTERKEEEIEASISSLYDCVQQVGGVFTLLFSNRDFKEGTQGRMWRRIFSEKLHENAE